MKFKEFLLPIFEKNDRVLTPDGYGTVIHDQLSNNNTKIYDPIKLHLNVLIQHDEATSKNTSNEPVDIEREMLILLDKFGKPIYLDSLTKNMTTD